MGTKNNGCVYVRLLGQGSTFKETETKGLRCYGVRKQPSYNVHLYQLKTVYINCIQQHKQTLS